MADENKIRIKDQPLDTALSPGDLIIVDSEESGVGTRKFDLGAKLESIDTDITDVKQDLEELQNDAGVTAELKSALLQLAEKVAYIDDDGQSYYDDLYDALYPNASSISCVYTQTGTVYTTDTLDGLKDDLVVTAHYSDSTTKVLKPSDYTLTGTLTAGTSTITVHYGNLTTTFTVTVTARTLSSISAVYTQGGTVYTDDDIDSLKSDLVVTATYNDSSTEIVPSTDYELSGTLTSGTSTITVTYENKTTTFTVTVTAPLYSIPDFAEQTVSSGGKSLTVKKENGIYTLTGTLGDVVYITPEGIASASRYTTKWFEIASGASVDTVINDITWDNSGAVETTLSAKLQRSDATGNLFTVEFTMGANSSGTGDSATITNVAGGIRNMSGVCFQILGTRNYSITASFKMRLFVDGVRYL